MDIFGGSIILLSISQMISILCTVSQEENLGIFCRYLYNKRKLSSTFSRDGPSNTDSGSTLVQLEKSCKRRAPGSRGVHGSGKQWIHPF